jgi:TolA-binding protein
VTQSPQSPEAPSSDLAWARALRREHHDAEAIARLEHLILTYPESALVPQARRELDAAHHALPSTS